jgi:hypothetical protein
MASLPAAADRAIAAIDEVATEFAAAHAYYDAENYKDDQFAKGKQIHEKITVAAKQFGDAIEELEVGLNGIEDAQAVAELQSYKDASDYSYWFRFYNIEAKQFVRAVDHARTPEQKAQLAAVLPALTTATADLEKFVDSKGTKLNQAFNAYLGVARSFHSLATKLVRETKSGGQAPDSSMLIGAYNNMVELANSLYKVEDAGGLN